MQKILHELKYRKETGVGVRLGELLGEELAKEKPFDLVDLIIPVPLHHSKQRKRGFNQAELIAFGASTELKKPLRTDILVRKVATATQTKRSRYDRWGNMDQVFEVQKPNSTGKNHVLLVDDVLTTGATIGSCAQVLIDAGYSVSVATVATA